MSYREDFDIAQRYDLLCRASQSSVEQDGQRLQLAADLDVLDKIINHDLPELARSGSPDHFADILKNLNLELEHFREFCEFPDLAQKVVVGVGGAFSAGKSSLINTLLGKKRLVVEIDPTTSLPTYLLHGEQEQITALNLFRRSVTLSQDEFASLTHEEKIKYGSQIAGLLCSAFVSDPDFSWKNIALLDTPGYSKPDIEQWSERTDESVARSQLNLSNFIIWVVSATQGTISEDDLKFLVTLNADIPKLIVVSRADAKTPEDVAKIVALVKQTTAERGINVLDVIPVSARKKNDYPVQPIVEFLERWNEQKRSLSFAQNFKRHFVGYSQFVQGKQQQAKTKLEQINKLLFLSDHAEQTQIVEKLKHIEKDSNKEWNDLPKNLEELQNQFFKKMNQLADSIRGYKEQLVDIETLLKDPNCSAEILQSYAERLDDEELLNLIYQHKNCPTAILERALNQSPVGSISIKKLQLLLENINFPQICLALNKHLNIIDINDLSDESNLKLTKKLGLDENKYELLSLNRNVLIRSSLAKNPNISEKIQLKLTQDEDSRVRMHLVENPNISGETQLKLTQAGYTWAIRGLVKNPNISKEIQLKIAQDKNDRVRRDLAKNPNISGETQLKLTQDEDNSVRMNLAKNPNISEEAQLKLTQDEYSLVRYYLAGNINISEEIQLKLSQDQHSSVRYYLAGNINISEEIQLKLSQDQHSSVRCYLAGNLNISEEIQLKLSQDEDSRVIERLEENPNISEKTQLKIIQDQDNWIRIVLAENPNISEEIQLKITQDKIKCVIENLVKNPNINDELQLNFSQDKKYWVRKALAENTNISKEIQSKFVQDDDREVRVNLVKNPNISGRIQLKLTQDKCSQVRMILAENRNISEDIQLKLTQDEDEFVRMILVKNPNISGRIQLELTQDKCSQVRMILAENRNISEDIQLKLTQDEDNWVRKALAKNLNISKEIQLRLAQDEDNFVRRALVENPNISEIVQLRLAQDEDNRVRETLAENPNISEEIQLKLAQNKNEEVKEALFQNPNLSVKVEQLLD